MSHNPNAPGILTPAGIVPKAGAKVEPFYHIRKFSNGKIQTIFQQQIIKS